MTSLRSFLDSLQEDEILRVREPIDLDYVPTAIVTEMERRKQFPMLYPEQPAGFDMPVVANLCADRSRIARMAGASSPADFNDAWMHAEENPTSPIVVDEGPVQEVIVTGDDVDATSLPISRPFAQDAGRYIGSGILICKDPDKGIRNLSYQRLQLKESNRFGASR